MKTSLALAFINFVLFKFKTEILDVLKKSRERSYNLVREKAAPQSLFVSLSGSENFKLIKSADVNVVSSGRVVSVVSVVSSSLKVVVDN